MPLWCLSKSSVLVYSSIGPFRNLLYFGILLTERAATSERTSQCVVQRRTCGIYHLLTRCCHFAGHCWKESEPPPLVGRSLFLYACVIPFSCQRPLGVSVYSNNFLFLIQFECFFFIHSLQISLTLFHHPSLLSISPGRSSRLHAVSAQRCCI